MHTDSLGQWEHSHVFLGDAHEHNERKTWIVIGLTTAMMVGEIIGGSLFGSMALVADGLHMSTHAGALLIAALAYTFARRHARNSRFAFGSGKFGDLAAFTSAIVLAMIALLIGYEALRRLLEPVPIAFDQAIPVAVLGLAVNLASAWLLRDDHHHHGHVADHDHHARAHHPHETHLHRAGLEADHSEGHGRHKQPHRDNNLRAAYVHVLADAATSVLAIIGLLAGWIYGWVFMDPVMGIVGALVIGNWSYGLVRDAGAVLLDAMPDPRVAEDIRHRLELGDDRITDLHLWRIGPGHYGAIISIVTHDPKSPADYKGRLASIATLAHVTVEVEACT